MKRYGQLPAVLCGTLAALALAAAAVGEKVAPGPTTAPAEKPFKIGEVLVDRSRREVSFDAEVCLDEGLLEFLLVGWQSKTHESILHTKAKASHIHAGLLSLGLAAGKPARWSGEDMRARFLPPAGAGLKVAFAWEDKDGKTRRSSAGKWLTGDDDKRITVPDTWIFVGSQVLPEGQYWAEIDGEIISLTNFASAVIDVPFESSKSNDMRAFVANSAAIPAIGTTVRVILTALPGGERAPDARMLVEIDRFGRASVDGKIMIGEEIEEWATDYILKHERGMVVIRAAGRAFVHDVAATQLSLRLGGMREFDVQRIRAAGTILPRTLDQAKRSLTEWEDKFANAHELIREPGQQAQRLLEQIRQDTRLIEARRKMLEQYAEELSKSLGRYRATTQPAAEEE